MKQFNLFSAAMLLSFFSYGQMVTLYDTTRMDSGFYVKKSEGMMKDGKKTGVWKTWDENGKLRSIGEYVPFTNDLITYINDTGFEFDTIAQKKIYSKYLSLKKGEWKYFYENGQLEMEGNYLPFQKMFIDASLDSETQKPVIVLYDPIGTREGLFKEYSKQGKLVAEETYKENILIDRTEY